MFMNCGVGNKKKNQRAFGEVLKQLCVYNTKENKKEKNWAVEWGAVGPFKAGVTKE